MSDISLDLSPLDIALMALIIGAPGLVLGSTCGLVAWRRHRLLGALIGALAGLLLWLAGFVVWKMTPWG